ncbi:hypothetical protein O0550_09560 [Brevibacillus halotolerans]|uniref:hypothetical protein n=1 Tax=Brevibacillus TaxID=55080 RepID=UPI00215CB94C|nr:MULTISPECIES: hypothetical protein [Brevibacillus]MCR8963449.1 hypothetical protein [Brevibacillus laterosporus]MCZ0835605.1 hypothetical protein [Brevibacillus halotolerans]
MIRMQGKYRLTFPVTPAEVQIKGYGNDAETSTSISLVTKNRLSANRAKSISFEFWLPGDIESPLIEVQGYQGPREWLAGLDRISGKEVLLTIDELNLAWNVLIGPVDGTFKGMNVDYYGSIELPIFIKDEFVEWSSNKELLQPPVIMAKQQKARANTTGKTAKKQQSSPYLLTPAKNMIHQDREIRSKQLTRIQKKNAEYKSKA